MEFATSWFGFLLLAATLGGSFPSDLVSLIDPDAYFRSRNIQVTAAQMAALAGKAPADAKDQIRQLLAIRWLGDHPEAVKNDKTNRPLLDEIAQGKKAQDPHGFARDYAQRALAQLDGKPRPAAPVPENSFGTAGIEWFPRSVAFVAGLDFRGSLGIKGIESRTVTELTTKVMPDSAREQVYTFAEAVGNLQLQRATIAFSPDPKEKRNGRICMRLSGRGQGQRLAQFLGKTVAGEVVVTEEKTAKGEPLTIFTPMRKGPAVAFLGESEVIIAGYDKPEEGAKQREVLQEVLDVRDGRQVSVVKGAPWAAELKEIPANAGAFFLGDLSDEMRKDLAQGTPFQVLPAHLAAHVIRGKELMVHFRGTFAGAADAKAFCDAVAQAKQMVIEGLKNLPLDVKIKPQGVEMLSKTVEAIRAEPKNSTVVGGLRVSSETVQTLLEVMEDMLKSAGPGAGR
jgi:hypothetical protein